MDFREECKVECCNNCKSAWLDRCGKLRELYKSKGCGYTEQPSPSYLDDQIKRNEIRKTNVCQDFKSRWIEYPIAVSEIKVNEYALSYNRGLSHTVGVLVKIRPCGKEYKDNKTYLGIYLGDLPRGIYTSHNPSTGILEIKTHSNPAIFVPELKKVIFGDESWWGEIEKEEDLKDITDDTINNQWYVKMLKELHNGGEED